ncbi:MAG: rod shape-determining protein [Patescibacteria group bacterium]
MRLKLPRSITDRFSRDIGIDLGTANTLVYLKGKGIVITEPSVVAVNTKTGQVVAVGAQARDMLGRTPAHILAVRPLVEGVVSDFEVTEEMLAYLIQKAQGEKTPLGPRVVIGVPSGITSVEVRAVRDAARNAGAREVHIIEEPMAAALGARLPVREPVGTMLVDIGGGTTDIALISLGGIVRSKNLRVAGDTMNQDISAYIRSEFKILIGDRTAEDIKLAVGTVLKPAAPLQTTIRGRDLVTGLPREIIITDADVREAIGQSVQSIVEAVKEVLETAPPEVVADVMRFGIYVTGGGALLRGLPELLQEELKVPIHLVEEPLTTVVRGTGIILEDIDMYQNMLLDDYDGMVA